MALNGWKCLERTLQWLEVAQNGCEMALRLMEMAGTSWTWMEVAGNVEYHSHVQSSVAAALHWAEKCEEVA